MIRTFFYIFLLYLVTQQSLIYAKINDPRVWTNLYESCYSEYTSDAQFTKKEFSKYCTCTADQVTEKLDIKELLLLESSILKQKSDEDQHRVMMANKKIENIVTDCISKIIN